MDGATRDERRTTVTEVWILQHESLSVELAMGANHLSLLGKIEGV
jgi:hypothetical protein